jgi:hypothetical protein
MKPGDPSACSEEPTTGSNPRAVEPNAHHHNIFILAPVLILSVPKSPEGPTTIFSDQNCVLSPMCVTCSAHLTLLHLSTLTFLCEKENYEPAHYVILFNRLLA